MMNPAYQYEMKLLRWVDGDTFDAAVALGFHASVEVRFRLLGVNTPERGQPSYDEARQIAEGLQPIGSSFVAQSIKGDKYGRWLVDLPAVREAMTAKGWVYV